MEDTHMLMLMDIFNQLNTSLTHTMDSKSSQPPTCQRVQLQFTPLQFTTQHQLFTGESHLMLMLTMTSQSQFTRLMKFSPLKLNISQHMLKPRLASTITTNAQLIGDQSTHPKFNMRNKSTLLLTNVLLLVNLPTQSSTTHNWPIQHQLTTITTNQLTTMLLPHQNTTGITTQLQHLLTESQSTQPRFNMPKLLTSPSMPMQRPMLHLLHTTTTNQITTTQLQLQLIMHQPIMHQLIMLQHTNHTLDQSTSQ